MRLKIKKNFGLYWLYALFAIFVFLPFEYNAGGIVIRPFDLAIGATFLLILCILFQRNNLTVRITSATFYTFLIIAFGLFSMLWAERALPVIIESIQWIEMLIFLFFMTTVLKSEEDIRQFLFVLFGLVVLLHFGELVHLVLKFSSSGLSKMGGQVITRRMGFLGAIGLIWVTAFYPSVHERNKKWLLLLVPIFLLSILLSTARMTYLGVSIAVSVGLFLYSKDLSSYIIKLVEWGLLFVLLFLLVVVMQPNIAKSVIEQFPPVTTNPEEIIESLIRSSEGRLCRLSLDINRFGEKPTLGFGMNNGKNNTSFGNVPFICRQKFGKDFKGIGVGAHNSFLRMFIGLGLVGGIFYLFLTLYPIRLITYWINYKRDLTYSSSLVFAISLYLFTLTLLIFRSSGLDRRLFLFTTLSLSVSYQAIIQRIIRHE